MMHHNPPPFQLINLFYLYIETNFNPLNTLLNYFSKSIITISLSPILVFTWGDTFINRSWSIYWNCPLSTKLCCSLYTPRFTQHTDSSGGVIPFLCHFFDWHITINHFCISNLLIHPNFHVKQAKTYFTFYTFSGTLSIFQLLILYTFADVIPLL